MSGPPGLPNAGRPQPANPPQQGKNFSVSPALQIPNFVEQYYKTSTFHHLASWKLQFQRITSMMAEKSRMLAEKRLHGRGRQGTAILRAERDEFEIEISTSSSSKKSKSGSNNSEGDFADAADIDKMLEPETDPEKRIIAHVDMDCFYVSVITRNKPELKNKPVVVCPSKNVQGSSEVASASYEARNCGIKARMFVSEAKKLCPDLVVLGCDYALIEDASARIYEQIVKYSVLIEPVSADEAYLDVSAWGWHRAQEFASRLRADIEAATDCPCSVGIGPNKLLARLSTSHAKPYGVRITTLEQAETFLSTMRANELPGIGRTLIEKLEQKGIFTVSDIRAQSLQRLQLWLGEKNGLMLFDFARGRDDRPIQTQHKRKSVGTQISWGVRLFSLDDVKRFLGDVAAEVSRRLCEINVKGRRITLRILKKADGMAPSVAPGDAGDLTAGAASAAGAMAPPLPPGSTHGKAAAPPTGKFMNPGVVQPISKSARLVAATNDANVLSAETMKIFRGMNLSPQEVRGVGLSIDQLEDVTSAPTERTLDSFFTKVPPKKASSSAVSSSSSSSAAAALKFSDFDDFGEGAAEPEPPEQSTGPMSAPLVSLGDSRTGPAHFELLYSQSSSNDDSHDSQVSEGFVSRSSTGELPELPQTAQDNDDVKAGPYLFVPGTPSDDAEPVKDEPVSAAADDRRAPFVDLDDVMSISSGIDDEYVGYQRAVLDESEDDEPQILDVKPKGTHMRKRKFIEDGDVVEVDAGDATIPPPKRRNVDQPPAGSDRPLKQPSVLDFARRHPK